MAAAKLQYCDRLAENMRSSFVNLVESRRKSIHHSLRASTYRASKRNDNDTQMNDDLEDPIDADTSVPAHEELDNSWNSWTRLDSNSTIMRSNRNTVSNEINIVIDEYNDNNTLDVSNRSTEFHPTQHHLLHKFTELGALAMEISTGQIEAPAPHEKVVIGIITAWFAFISCIIFIPMDVKQREFIIGIAVNVNMSFFYGAPLSIIWKVLRTRDSSWIHRRTMIMNTLCALFFLAFGFGRMDWFLIIPNGIGVILGAVQVFLRLLIPSCSGGSNLSKMDSSAANLADVVPNHSPIKKTVDEDIDESYEISRDSETSA